MATPDDVAGAVGYLVSDAASYVTGQNLSSTAGGRFREEAQLSRAQRLTPRTNSVDTVL